MTTTLRGADAALAYLRQHADEHLGQLDDFLRIPSIAFDVSHADDCRRAAQWVADLLTAAGADNARLTETIGQPIVTAEWMHAGPDKPTVLVYAHYDVQPTDPLDEWVRPPFEPRYEDDKVYARGSGDDKSQVFMHIKAFEAWVRGAGGCPVNLRFFFEGDEEHDSRPTSQFIAEHPELLRADFCLVSDSDMQDDEGTPAITYGLRGIAYWEVRVQGPRQDLHSGQYGGGVDNPANVLVRMLASLTDVDGRVTVPGFYDSVRDLTDAERAAYAAQPFDADDWAQRIGVPGPQDGERGYTLLERMSGRPTFDINGLWGGYSGAGSKTIIPAFAAAKISCRLVPDQDHRQVSAAMVEHLQRIAPPTVTVTVTPIQGGHPLVTPLDHPAVARASTALRRAFGKDPVFHRSGGSIPVAPAMSRELGLQCVMVGFASPNGNFHAPNEWMPLANYRGGMDALVYLWEELAGVSPEELRGA
jgi:acetylornithine deacetylase/succinyl-diaminopimelate desuccinylase-like protein